MCAGSLRAQNPGGVDPENVVVRVIPRPEGAARQLRRSLDRLTAKNGRHQRRKSDTREGANGDQKMTRIAADFANLDAYGWAILPKLLTRAECEITATMYAEDRRFRFLAFLARDRIGLCHNL